MNINNFKDIPIRINESLALHTGFRTGGAADYILLPNSEEQLIFAIEELNKTKQSHFILGNGSNVIALDEGYRGVVVKTDHALNEVQFNGNRVICGAGVQLSALCLECEKKGLSGLEFAYGIPGTVGGAIFMNAGAYDGEIKDVVSAVTVFDAEEKKHVLSNEQMQFAYRTSLAQATKLVILSAEFSLVPKNREQIMGKMKELMQKRRDKQPLELPSCGSTFKRPAGAYASKLIDECGLRGMMVGGAQVSEKHCGFLVNKNNATSANILELADNVCKLVKDKTGFELECEIRILR